MKISGLLSFCILKVLNNFVFFLKKTQIIYVKMNKTHHLPLRLYR
jgi:hypothetical protein